jgi:ribosomal protein L11 methyltransferase
MMQKFIVLKMTADAEYSEIVQAELAAVGFDSFMDEGEGFISSVAAEYFDKEAFREVTEQYKDYIRSFEIAEQELQNWNVLWESHYEPVEIGDLCCVRAHFHPENKKFKHSILITPKMSFGTGHHATTRMMLEYLLEIDVKNKNVLDLGCGTAILAIMADKLGAKFVTGCDIDDWVIDNAEENIVLNQAACKVFLGTANDVSTELTFEIVLANINLHVLREELHIYEKLLAKNGMLLMSGFLASDIQTLQQDAAKFGLKCTKTKITENGSWASLAFERE